MSNDTPMQGWMPIETRPTRYGEQYLVTPYSRNRKVGVVRNGYTKESCRAYDQSGGVFSMLVVAPITLDRRVSVSPSYWRPLPPPPEPTP